MRGVPPPVVNDFLGAGKTSLPRHLLTRKVTQTAGNRLQHHSARPWRAGAKRGTRPALIGRKGVDRGAIIATLSG